MAVLDYDKVPKPPPATWIGYCFIALAAISVVAEFYLTLAAMQAVSEPGRCGTCNASRHRDAIVWMLITSLPTYAFSLAVFSDPTCRRPMRWLVIAGTTIFFGGLAWCTGLPQQLLYIFGF